MLSSKDLMMEEDQTIFYHRNNTVKDVAEIKSTFSNTEKKSSPDFAIKEGFVVIPSKSPVSLRSFMTSTSAVSKKKSILF